MGVPNTAPVQQAASLGFGNLARRVRGLGAFTYTHSGTASKENEDPESPLPALDLSSQLHLGGGAPHNPGGNKSKRSFRPAEADFTGEQEGLAESVFWVKLGGVLSLRLWAL